MNPNSNVISVFQICMLFAVLCEDTATVRATTSANKITVGNETIPCASSSSSVVQTIPNLRWFLSRNCGVHGNHREGTNLATDPVTTAVTTDASVEAPPLAHMMMWIVSTLHCIIIVPRNTKIDWELKIPDSVFKQTPSCRIDRVIEGSCIIYDIQVTVNDVDQRNDGDFICSVNGSFGRREQILNSDILSKINSPDPDVQVDKASISVSENATARWELEIGRTTKPKLQWYKNGAGIDFRENNTLGRYMHSSKGSIHFFSILSTTPDDTANYTIHVTVLDRTVKVPLYLAVQGRNDIFHIDGPDSHIKGDNATIICIAPRLTYTEDTKWALQDSEALDLLPGKREISEKIWRYVSQSIMNIQNLTHSDAGNYCCQAKRKDGTIEWKCYNLSVVDSKVPSIFYTNMNGSEIIIHPETYNGTSIELVCKADGLPKPKIIWKKDGKIIANTSNKFNLVSDNTTLQLTRFWDESYSGEYQCTAENRVGSDTANFKVTIEGKTNDYLITFYIVVACFLGILMQAILMYGVYRAYTRQDV